MAAFNFAIVPWSSWTNQFVIDTIAFTEFIKRMYAMVFSWICELKSIISLSVLTDDMANHFLEKAESFLSLFALSPVCWKN